MMNTQSRLEVASLTFYIATEAEILRQYAVGADYLLAARHAKRIDQALEDIRRLVK